MAKRKPTDTVKLARHSVTQWRNDAMTVLHRISEQQRDPYWIFSKFPDRTFRKLGVS